MDTGEESQIDSVKISIVKPMVLFGGLGYAAGIAKVDEYRVPRMRDRMKSSQAFTGLGIGSMAGFVLGHSRRRFLRRIALAEAAGSDRNKNSVSNAYILLPAIACGAYGTALGYAFYSNPDTGPTLSEHTEAIIIGGGIGSLIGAGLGGLVRAVVQNEKRRKQRSRQNKDTTLIEDPR